jgi:hypothetical protein
VLPIPGERLGNERAASVRLVLCGSIVVCPVPYNVSHLRMTEVYKHMLGKQLHRIVV